MSASDHHVHPSKWIIGPPAPSLLAVVARLTMVALVVLMTTWLSTCLGGFAWVPEVTATDPVLTNDTGKMFNWHPLLMTLAFGVCMAEALMAYQSPLVSNLTRAGSKKMHYSLHALATICVAVSVAFAFQSHNLKLPTPMANMYSAHSVLGISVVCMVGLQVMIGVYSYLFPMIPLNDRVALGPVHRFLGVATWVAGLAAMATGIQEKTTFVQTGKKLGGADLYSATMRLPAVMLVVLLLLAVTVLYHLVPPASAVKHGKVVCGAHREEGQASEYESLDRRSSLEIDA